MVDTLVQTFDSLPPYQRAIAESMRMDWRVAYAIDTQTGFALNVVDAFMLFDGSMLVPLGDNMYLTRHVSDPPIHIVMERLDDVQ